MSKKKKKLIIVITVLVVVLGLAVFGLRSCMLAMAGVQAPVETTVLEAGDMMKTVIVTGTVESQEVEKVFARLSYPVEELHVKVGDSVQAGDVLCVLDTKDLANNIAQQRATVAAQQQTTNQSVNVAQKSYNNALDALEEQYDQQLKSAEKALMDAEATLEKAGISVREARGELKNGRDDDLDDDAIAQLKRREQSAAVDYEMAQASVEYAKIALEGTKKNAQQQLESYQDAVTTAQISGNSIQATLLAIEKLEQDLESATITAPADGTVTAVYAEQGATSTGLMFVIEETSKLKVVTKIKEYDVAEVYVGAKVNIRSDATGSEIFEGRVSSIAPTSLKTATGDSADSTDAEFETEIEVLTPDSGLRIGTNARLTIIVEERFGTLAVPYEAIAYNEQGEEVVYIPQWAEDGTTTVQPVVIETGMESDFSVEIIGGGLAEGDEVLSNAASAYPGMPVLLMADFLAAQAAGQDDPAAQEVMGAASGGDAEEEVEESSVQSAEESASQVEESSEEGPSGEDGPPDEEEPAGEDADAE